VNRTVLGFIRKELVQALRDPRMFMVMFAMPVVQMVMFGYALTSEIRNIRLAVVSAPGDVMASRLAERAFSSGWFLPADLSGMEPVSALKARRADAVVITPPGGLDRAFVRGGARLQVLVDATNAIKARSVEFYLNAILSRMAAEQGAGGRTASPVSLDVRALFNPSMKSSVFMVPAVMVFVLAVVSVLLTSMSIAREKEMGTMEMLISAPVSRWEILLGKTVPYILIGVIDVPLVLFVAVGWFGVPMRGSFWVLVLAAVLFVIAASSVGTLISTLARNQQQAMMGSFMFMLPAILLSGIMFPLENMPKVVVGITYLNPLRYFVTVLRNIMLKGGDASVVFLNLAALAALAAAAAVMSYSRFRQTLN